MNNVDQPLEMAEAIEVVSWNDIPPEPEKFRPGTLIHPYRISEVRYWIPSEKGWFQLADSDSGAFKRG